MHYPILILAIALLTTGCKALHAPIMPVVNAGASVQINAQFDALPNYTRLYFQDGMRVTQKAVDKWSVYCRLHVFNRNQGADYLTSVAPGNFRISSVQNRVQSSEAGFAGSGSYISTGLAISSQRNAMSPDWEHEGPPSYYLYRVEMRLDSADQPDVKTLTCSRKWSTRGYYFPTLVEIGQALGDLIEIKAPV